MREIRQAGTPTGFELRLEFGRQRQLRRQRVESGAFHESLGVECERAYPNISSRLH